jgi:hypothetical protein
MSDTTLKYWILPCISMDYTHLVPFLIKKNSAHFLLLQRHTFVHIYVAYMYIHIYMYIIPNFIEKHNLKFKTNLMRWLNLCEEFFVLLYMYSISLIFPGFHLE